MICAECQTDIRVYRREAMEHLDRADAAEAEVERLKAELDNERSAYARIAAKAKARIEAALAIYNEKPPNAETSFRMVKALRGEK